ncbi:MULTISPECIES: type VI secretion system baseplate subunit TssF [Polyangium]|uniref:Type VI secretion system baseplate subunit TssF n=2 Tax=Polyangium TaxID=55 RepID=A0A4V5PSU3_9BACT|nr:MULTISPECIES: type VI secretion system baseplate subunit TssF [Polyangium]MDI1433600.1 type VI secretion system baseplate subunit TssF [Polyangium sorediatum]TKD12141.1 type VI secretion system baseplate subunit TssF [Polyangium fumosum]
MFNKYYQDELSYLRELGREFAQAYPAIAPMLAERGADPDVERLLEGVAFLTGKIRQKLDDELPEVIHSVASLLFPHYLRQIPATSIVEFTPLPNVVREKLIVARHAEVGSVPVDGVSCRFRTTQDVELLPLTVEDVRVETGAQLAQSLRIEVKVTGGAALAALALSKIRFYIHGERRLQDDVRVWLGAHVDSIALCAVDGAGRDTTLATLPARNVKLVGFEEDEALIPYPPTVYGGFRLLQEYFTLPQKFAFFEIQGLEAMPADKLSDRFAILIQFKDGLPAGTRLSKENFRLFCSPVVNLFEHSSDPIKPDPSKYEYLARPAGSTPVAYELYSIESVIGIARRTSQRVKIPPFFSFEHELDPEASARGVFYQTHIKPASIGDGVDIYVSFGSAQDGASIPEFDVISIEATCTNRRLPAQLKVGDLRVPTATSPAVASFTNVTGVTAPLPPPMGRELQWRVLSHMAMSYRSITELDVLRSVLEIYNFPALIDRQAARANQLRMQAIKSIRVRPTDRLYRGAPVRGVATEVELDEGGFAGEGEMYLFASILNEMLAAYVSLNSFTQLSVTGTNTRVVYRWEPKSGSLNLI